MTSRHEDTDAALPLTSVELHVLLVLAEGEAHGYHIIQRSRERSDGAVDLLPGTLYRALHRMQVAQWVRRTEGPPGHLSSDSRRRYYALTEYGRRVVAAEIRRLARLVREARSLDLLGAV